MLLSAFSGVFGVSSSVCCAVLVLGDWDSHGGSGLRHWQHEVVGGARGQRLSGHSEIERVAA